MKKKLAFVLSGGGARGALQVGALPALLECGLLPDLLVGTSIGAINAALLAINGFTTESLEQLNEMWIEASHIDFLPGNYLSLTFRSMFRNSARSPANRMREFIIASGMKPETTFGEINAPRLVIVSSDLNSGKPVVHGDQLDENILEALLLSSSLPPWFKPVRKQNRFIVDGAIVSNLPVETALNMEATHIVALDLFTRDMLGKGTGIAGFLDTLIFSSIRRQVDLELALAEAKGVPVLYIGLNGSPQVPLWDFHHTKEMIDEGNAIAQQVISEAGDHHPVLLQAKK
jgi:NTE family protein